MRADLLRRRMDKKGLPGIRDDYPPRRRCWIQSRCRYGVSATKLTSFHYGLFHFYWFVIRSFVAAAACIQIQTNEIRTIVQMCEELAYTKARMTLLCVPIAIAQQMVYFFNIPHHYSRGSGAAVQHKLRKRASVEV